jgi:hypothetical protein
MSMSRSEIRTRMQQSIDSVFIYRSGSAPHSQRSPSLRGERAST